ncbi:helix-turn-helix domain-containing protein [Janthinobacterium aquaticum]|nr:helix-turn-helix domain-containing protein [Janthinobacterium sp. FT58W]
MQADFQKLLPVNARAMAMSIDYEHGHVISVHRHAHAQLIYAIQGVMTIATPAGRWVVPPTRGVWLRPGVEHQIRMSGAVRMGTVFINCANSPILPRHSCVLGISPLLRQLIVAAVDIAPDFADGGRDWHLLQLLLHELDSLPVLPLHLPLPQDARLQGICERLMEEPGEQLTVAHWAAQLSITERSLHRLFHKQTGMRFGQWRQQARLLRALEQLAHGAKVIDVALDNGYTSQSAFTAMFRKHFGTTPSDFYRDSATVLKKNSAI